MVTDMLEAAIEAGEVPDQPYQELLPRLFWDYQTGIMAYWLRDSSKDFENTTQLLDKSMGIVATFLQQGLVGKGLDLMSFLFRTHIMSHLDSFANSTKPPQRSSAASWRGTMNQKLPQGKLARAKVAGIAAIKVGTGELQHKVKRAFLSTSNERQTKQKLDEKNAAILFGAMTQLRGTALKIAQMIGMELDLLPASYQQELQKSFHQVPPLNKVLIRKVMIEQLGQSSEKLFASFDPALLLPLPALARYTKPRCLMARSWRSRYNIPASARPSIAILPWRAPSLAR